jgi:hypothetical protein
MLNNLNKIGSDLYLMYGVSIFVKSVKIECY